MLLLLFLIYEVFAGRPGIMDLDVINSYQDTKDILTAGIYLNKSTLESYTKSFQFSQSIEEFSREREINFACDNLTYVNDTDTACDVQLTDKTRKSAFVYCSKESCRNIT